MGKNILITGCNGFIGRSLTEFLKDKHNVFAMSHDSLDLLNEKSVNDFFNNNRIDIIVHCAVSSQVDKNNNLITNKNSLKNNLSMFFNLEKNLNEEMIMINCGSGAEYDKRRSLQKVREEEFGFSIPCDDYGFSKYIISKHVMTSKKNIINLRIFGLYGKYENYRFKFISNAIVKNMLNLPIIINKNVVFDYLYIDDFNIIIERLIESNIKKGNFNVTPKESIDLLSLAKIINDISDFNSNLMVLNKGLNKEYTACNENLLNCIGNIEFTCYKSAIKNLYDFYRKEYKAIDLEEIKNDKYLMYVKSVK